MEAAMTAPNKPARRPLPIAPYKPAPYSGPSREETLRLRREFVNPGVFAYYEQPLMIVDGRMQYVWDEAGKQYLDAFGGIVTVSVGHSHPDVTRAVVEQIERLVHTTTIYLHPTMPRLAQQLAGLMPADSGLTSTFFTNAGNEANEAALLMARMHTGRNDAIALRNAYHGGSHATMGLTAVGTWKFPVAPAAGVKHVPAAYCYRCPFGLTYPSCEMKCAKSVEDTIRYETSGEVAAFIAEPIQGVGGVVTPPREYFGIVYDIVRKHGGLCIADEVQSGFGRTGEHTWGFENWGVVPDIVTMAKGIGNGAPLAACTTRPEVAATLSKRVYFNTFGGNPVSMAAGLATLEIMQRENTRGRAREMGGRLRAGLLELQNRHPLIGEVRGLGLMLGVEFVRDRANKEPATAETARLMNLTKERGLLIGRGGLFGNVVRLAPPMCLTADDVDFLVDCLDECLTAIAGK